MKKFILAVALAVAPVLGFAAPVFADSPGQLSNGPDNYKVRNVTQNGAYSQSVSAACNETVKYSITLSNSDFGLLKNVTVKANLASGAINASATNNVGDTTSVNGSVNVSHTGTLKYVAGSTVRITSDGQNSTAKPDGVAGAGVNVGDLNGSTAIFVQFQAKVECPTTPPVTPPTTTTPVTPAAPQVLAATGPVETFAQIVGVTALAGAISYYIRSRRANILG